ncbi:MAG: hypothetical protein V3U75_10970 [Methylococcaceae bacterium]
MALTDKHSPTFWREHIEQWQSSGLSQAAYCRQHALIVHQFRYWNYKLRRVERPTVPTATSDFARVQVESTRNLDCGLSLHFADGTRLDGIHPHNVMTVCQLIEGLR